jgi:hypothetical protein
MRPESVGLLVDIRNATSYVINDTADVSFEAFVRDQRLRLSV